MGETPSAAIARYDGLADWYEETARPSAEFSREALMDLLGPAAGLCLDLGCGTGLYGDILRSSGRDVIGVDASRDQLRIAANREPVVAGDATQLPFRDGSFDDLAAIWVPCSWRPRRPSRSPRGGGPGTPPWRAVLLVRHPPMLQRSLRREPRRRRPSCASELPGIGLASQRAVVGCRWDSKQCGCSPPDTCRTAQRLPGEPARPRSSCRAARRAGACRAGLGGASSEVTAPTRTTVRRATLTRHIAHPRPSGLASS